jgi:hypothetical protein
MNLRNKIIIPQNEHILKIVVYPITLGRVPLRKQQGDFSCQNKNKLILSAEWKLVMTRLTRQVIREKPIFSATRRIRKPSRRDPEYTCAGWNLVKQAGRLVRMILTLEVGLL